MNRNFVISVVVMFFVTTIAGFVVHGMILGGEYAKLTSLFRPHEEFMSHYAAMAAANLAVSIALTWIYRQGREAKPFLAQGIRFGLAVALLGPIPTYLVYYAVQPMPSDLVAQQIVLETIAMVIVGIVVAAINRDPVRVRA